MSVRCLIQVKLLKGATNVALPWSSLAGIYDSLY